MTPIMTPAEREAWNTWVEYCRKLKLYYDATGVAVTEKPELEPWGMNPPPCVIIDGTLAADIELTRLRSLATRWYLADGTFKTLPEEEVIQRRKAAAVTLKEIDRLREVLATDHIALVNESFDIGGWETLSPNEKSMVRITLVELRRRAKEG
jgi:hypothetical protein